MSWPTGAGPTLLTGPAGTLEARLAAPEGAPRALAVICHPHPLFGGSMDNKVVTTLERVFLARDCATVRFNFRGVGGSAGVHDDAQGEVDDLRAVVQQAQDWLPGLPLWLAGFSFGAGFKVNRFRIDYGYSAFHLGGGLNHFGLSTNLQEFKR